MKSIPFNKPFLTGKEAEYILDAVQTGKISGNGKYTRLCHDLLGSRYGFKKCLLTTSCTDALEMAAILTGIGEGDEVILPSYTFVSTANAFVLRGARLVFADSGAGNPNIDAAGLEYLVTSKTKAIVVVHYAGVACDMDTIMAIADRHGLFVIEDSAQAIDSYYTNSAGRQVPLGSIGHLAAFSFHETKNVISGEGGMLVINDSRFADRAEIIWEKGTNRAAFFRGEIDKYNWVDIGSSFLPSEIIAAFLYAQLEQIERIQERRIKIWEAYRAGLAGLQEKGFISLPMIPAYAGTNGHLFYIVCKNVEERGQLIATLKKENILVVFHYLSLHQSPFYASRHDGRKLIFSDLYSERLLRLPLYFELEMEEQQKIIACINSFYELRYNQNIPR